MAKTKKLLCLAVAIALVSSLIAMPASAEVTIGASVTFEGGTWPSVASKTHYGMPSAEIYGKDETDYSAASPTNTVAATETGTDRFFQVMPSSQLTIPYGGMLKISFDIATNSINAASSYDRYVTMNLNTTRKALFRADRISLDNPTYFDISKFKTNAWNNVTAIFKFNETNTSSAYTMYINGVEALKIDNFNPLSGTAWTTVGSFRFGGYINVDEKLYYDNICIEAYESTDAAPSATFTSSATSTDSSIVIDNTNKKVRIADDMSVAAFTENTTNFVLLDATGNAIAEGTPLTDASVKLYAKYINGINMYYEPYTVEIIPPVITGNNTTYQEIINNDTKEIRVVDMPELTVGSFKANITNTGVLSITKNGAEANNSELLKDCVVRLTLGTTYDYTYTVVTARSYTIENENFETGTLSGKNYNGNGITWTGNNNGITGVTYSLLDGYGGKEAGDKSFAMVLENTANTSTKDAMIYLANPYVSGGSINTTHTIEAKINVSSLTNVEKVEMLVSGQVVLTFKPDGTASTIGGKTEIEGGWTENEWLPIAVTMHKGTKKINVYANGTSVNVDWEHGTLGDGIRFRPTFSGGASGIMAIDDVKFYTDSLEKVKYTVTGSAVTAAATESLNCVPVIALYGSDDSFLGATIGKTSKTISKAYAQGQKVKVLLLESLEKIKPITKAYPAV